MRAAFERTQLVGKFTGKLNKPEGPMSKDLRDAVLGHPRCTTVREHSEDVSPKLSLRHGSPGRRMQEEGSTTFHPSGTMHT